MNRFNQNMFKNNPLFLVDKIRNLRHCHTIRKISQIDANQPSSSGRDQVTVSPDPKSKLRLFRFAIPENESELERRYRLRRMEVQRQNQEFWSEINQSFNTKRTDFIENQLKPHHIDPTTQQSHEELADFYRKFLNDNHQKYVRYNL